MTELTKPKERTFNKYLPQLGSVKPNTNSINKKIKKKLEKPMTIEKLRLSLNNIEEFISEGASIENEEFDKFEEIQNFNFLKLNLLNSSIKTSNNTLENAPTLTATELDKAGEQYDKTLSKHSNIDFNQQFNQWELELTLGFNLIFFGIGSKLKIINEFSNYLNSTQGYHLIITNGNNNTTKFNLKLISQTWLLNILQLNQNLPLKLKDQLELIYNNYNQEKILLVVHNLDQLKLTKYQVDTLQKLTNLKNVNLLISVDKWDTQLKLQNFKNFNLIYHKLTNYTSYRLETKYLSLNENKKQKISLVGVQHVINSVSEKAKRMFNVLINNEGDDNRIGLQYSDLFDKCKFKFLVSNEVQLNSLLKEFIDHGVIIQSQDATAGQSSVIHGFLWVPLGKEDIKKLVL